MTERMTDRAGAAGGLPGSSGSENVVDLIGRLTSQGAHLAQEQVALIQAEVREGVSDIRKVIAAYTTAAIMGLAGLGVTLTGAGWLIGDAIDNVPLGIVLTGGATLLLAAVLYAGARSRVSATDPTPERTLSTLHDAPDIISGTHSHTFENRQGGKS